MSERAQLLEAVRRSTAGTPYVVTETPSGFDVALDVVDAQWFGLYSAEGLKKVFVHHVSAPGDGTYSVTDDAFTLEWEAGVPTLSASVERTRGHVKEVGFEKVWAFDRHGRFGKVVDVQFDSERGRRLIGDAAAQVGLRKERGSAERIGLVFAVVGALGAVLTLVVLFLL